MWAAKVSEIAVGPFLFPKETLAWQSRRHLPVSTSLKDRTLSLVLGVEQGLAKRLDHSAVAYWTEFHGQMQDYWRWKS